MLIKRSAHDGGLLAQIFALCGIAFILPVPFVWTAEDADKATFVANAIREDFASHCWQRHYAPHAKHSAALLRICPTFEGRSSVRLLGC